MNLLKGLPAQAVLPVDNNDLAALRTEADEAEQQFMLADCAGCADKDAVLRAIAQGLAFGDYFGVNLDALYDCVTDLEPDHSSSAPGIVVVLKDLPDTASFASIERNRVLDVFRDAAEFFAGDGVAFRVFYSVDS